MTVTIDATPFLIDLLTANGIRFVLEDKRAALREEEEYGKKLRAGSPKHVAHLKRLASLNAHKQPERPTKDNSQPQADAASLTQDQEDAVKFLVKMNDFSQTTAEKAVRQVQGESSADIVTQCIQKKL